jgi:phage gp36-like protein
LLEYDLLFAQAFSYVECSARTTENVKLAFEEAIRVALGKPSQVANGLVNVELDDADQRPEESAGVEKQPGMSTECCIIG